MRKDKVFKIVALIGLFLISFSSISTFASSVDSTWHNEYRIYSQYDHTPSRPKENKTAYYNLMTKSSGLGSYINIWAALSDGTDVSDGHSYVSRDGQEVFLYNLAVEKYNPGISVRIDSQRWANGSADGVWSPDSVR